MEDLKWFVLVFIGLWVLWLLTGGTMKNQNRYRPLLEQPAPIETGKPYTIEELKNKQ